MSRTEEKPIALIRRGKFSVLSKEGFKRKMVGEKGREPTKQGYGKAKTRKWDREKGRKGGRHWRNQGEKLGNGHTGEELRECFLGNENRSLPKTCRR